MTHEPLHEPLDWTVGALGGVAAVLSALALDPTGVVAAVLLTLIQQAGTLFTVLSIGGFTVAPNVPTLGPYVPYLQGAAIGTGIIFALTLLDQVWDNLKERILP